MVNLRAQPPKTARFDSRVLHAQADASVAKRGTMSVGTGYHTKQLKTLTIASKYKGQEKWQKPPINGFYCLLFASFGPSGSWHGGKHNSTRALSGTLRRLMSNLPPLQRLVSIREAAVYLNLSPHTLYTMVSQRRVPYVKVGRLTKFDRAELDKWIRNNSVMPMPPKTG